MAPGFTTPRREPGRPGQSSTCSMSQEPGSQTPPHCSRRCAGIRHADRFTSRGSTRIHTPITIPSDLTSSERTSLGPRRSGGALCRTAPGGGPSSSKEGNGRECANAIRLISMRTYVRFMRRMDLQPGRITPWRRASSIEWTEATWNPVTGCIEGLARLRPLLRGDVRRALARRARPSLRAGLRPASLARATRAAAALDAAADDLRELDERPVPRGHPARVHRAGLRRDGARRLGTPSRS